MPVGWAAPPPIAAFANYRPLTSIIAGSRPAPHTSRRWGVPLHIRPAQGTGKVAPSPRMVSDSQSAPIRAIGGRLKIRGHPAPRVGEFANRGDGQRPKVQTFRGLRRRPSSEGIRVRQVFWGGEIRPREGVPRFGTPPPPPPPRSLHRPRGPIRVGIGGSLPGETSSPRTLPSFSVLCGSSSALPPMSCVGIRVRGPEFPKPTPSRPEPIRVDRGFFEPPIVLDDGGGSSSPMTPLSRPSPHSKIRGVRFPPAPHRRRGRWGADSGDPCSERLSLRDS